MRIIKNPPKEEWPRLSQRNYSDSTSLFPVVSNVFDAVAERGDVALKELTLRYDKVELESFRLGVSELERLAANCPKEVLAALKVAERNIRLFHSSESGETGASSQVVETSPGVFCWRRTVALERVGLYVPGGTAPLVSSLLMLGVPAKLADCSEIVVCSPPDESGGVSPAIAAAALQIGLEQIYCLGGAQAIAAMTLGTETVPKVDKLFGPGNSYVTAAKAYAQANFARAIDLPAGPTEVLVVADATVPASFIAADLLAQAEHGADSDVVLVCLAESYAEAVLEETKRQIANLPRSSFAEPVLARARTLVFNDLKQAMAFANEYAAEHLLLMCEDAEKLALGVRNAGSVFLGAYTPESLGDYASGTNHTLPTAGAARSYSGVSLASFQKQVSFQQASYAGLEGLAPSVLALAEAETLKGHADAVRIRLREGSDV